MKYIDISLGKLLFERLEEILSNENLTPKERIPKYRTILEDLFKALTSDIKRHVSGLSAKSSFIFEEYDVPSHIKGKTSALRKYANNVVHQSELIPTDFEDLHCVYQLSEVISHFSQSKIPPHINDRYKSQIENFKKEVRESRPKLESYDIYAVINEIYVPDGEAGNKYIVLRCDTDELGQISIRLWNNKDENGFGSDLTVFKEVAQQYQNIFITNVVKYPEKENDYYANKNSYLVLEPDYLIDAKVLSECRLSDFQSSTGYKDNPLLFLLGKFTKGEITSNVMVGNIVGKMLDEIITKKEYEYINTFDSVMRNNSFGMLCLANDEGLYNRENINSVFLQSKDHESSLKQSLKEFQRGNCIVEPTFISNKYGLQGRLDLLVEHEKSNKKDIVELKSSKRYPNERLGLWPNHEAQAMCYDLLITSTYPNRTGTSSILYSATPVEEKPLRNVGEEKYLNKQDLLMTRNIIVSNELKLAEGKFDSFKDMLSDEFDSYPPYLEELVYEFQGEFKNLDGLIEKYFYGFFQFIYKELVTAKIGGNNTYDKSNGYADLWKASKSEKIDNYDVLIYLKVEEVTDEYHICLELDRNLFSSKINVSSFRIGDSAILYPTPNQDELNPLRSQILKCRVISIIDDKIEVSLINKQVDKSYFESCEYWALDRDFREYGFNQNLNLLYEFIKSDNSVIDLVLGNMEPQFNDHMPIEQGDLDDVQFENVKNAISAKDYYLIQGPPGTGKTSKVLTEIVRNLSVDQNIMVVAYTNRAVDEICEKLVKMEINCIRIGKGNEDYHWSTLSAKLKLDELNQKAKETKIFVSTISTFAASLDLLKIKEFDTLIVDEASQILEPQLVGVLKHFNKWIFIGDENQLSAVVSQSKEDSVCEDKELNELLLNNFRESLFYRLKKNAIKKGWNNCHGALQYQYRMHEDIADFPNSKFYKQELKNKLDIQKAAIPDYHIENQVSSVFKKSRVVFIPTKVDKSLKINNEEASLIVSLLQHIKEIKGDSFDPKQSVGVITPFRAQIANIRIKLNGQFDEVAIDTVERFQGSERDIIIISFAIKSTNQLASIQSLNDEGVDRKLNVAITRAKEHLIMIGSEDVLAKNKLFKDLIQYSKSLGGYMMNPLKEDSSTNNLF
jgi:DNA replication ATP-dependent helicase Dna2